MYKPNTVNIEGVYKNKTAHMKNQNLSSKNIRQFTRS
jgi:hypothetical protein